jgi:hypothetical protein
MNEEELPQHNSNQEQCSDSELYQFPKPKRRPRNDPKARKDRSKAQERGISGSYRSAGFTQSRRIPGSGAFEGLKGDVDSGSWFLAECKQTRGGRLTIDPHWYDKIEREARDLGRPWWVLHAWVGNETSNYRRVVILDEDHFFQLIKRLKDYEQEG